MDIGAVGILNWIASSTNSSLTTYDPIFLMVGGLILAIGVMSVLVGLLSRGAGGVDNGIDGMDLDDTMEI